MVLPTPCRASSVPIGSIATASRTKVCRSRDLIFSESWLCRPGLSAANLPRIDQFEAHMLEIGDIAGDQHGCMRNGNRGYLRVKFLHGAPNSGSVCTQAS